MLPRLESLELSCALNGPASDAVLGQFNLAKLRSLELVNYRVSKTWRDRDSSHVSSAGAITNFPNDGPPKTIVAPFRLDKLNTLNIIGLQVLPEVVESIMQRSSKLVSLSLSHLNHIRFKGKYTLCAIERIINEHRETLQYIPLGELPETTSNLPSFAHFPHLRAIHLSQYDLLAETPNSAARKMPFHSLRHMCVDFNIEVGKSLIESGYGSKVFAVAQVQWFENFIAILKPLETVESSQLETMFIKYHLSYSRTEIIRQIRVNPAYPCTYAYLELAKEKAAGRKVSLTWSPPMFTRQE